MTTILGLDSRTVAESLDGVVEAGPAPSDDIAAAFARASWSCVVEPADPDAGALVRALGATRAFDGVLGEGDADRLVDAVADVDAALADELRPRIDDALGRWRTRMRSSTVLHALRLARHVGAHLVHPGSPGWPAAVDELGDHAPLALWLRGPMVQASAPSVSLVGARAATSYGEHVASELAGALVDRGVAIVSGGAYGIDGVAHRTALACDGTTIAFLACGVDRFYPSGHHELLDRVASTGCVASELPCGTSPTRWRFLQRNRLIAAYSLATVVVEAGRRSGSLNTAGHAAALGRPLGAVPGPITSPASAGCHRLLREYAAVCVTSAADAMELAGLSVDGCAPAAAVELPAEHRRVLEVLRPRSPQTIDIIASHMGASIATVAAALGRLSLDGAVEERADGWVSVSRAR